MFLCFLMFLLPMRVSVPLLVDGEERSPGHIGGNGRGKYHHIAYLAIFEQIFVAEAEYIYEYHFGSR